MDNLDLTHQILSIDSCKGRRKTVLYKCCKTDVVIKQRLDVYRLRGCLECNKIENAGKTRLSHDEFKSKFDKANRSNLYELVSNYEKATIKIKVKHKVCNKEYLVSPYHFLNGNGCPKCANYKLTQEEFLEKYGMLFDDYTILNDFSKLTTKLDMKHNECGYLFKMTPQKFIYGQKCPKCFRNKSKSEAYTEAFFRINNIEYIREYRIAGCKNKHTLPFDFAVFVNGDLNCLIECDGRQHHDRSSIYFSEKKIKNDSIKEEYCKLHDIDLLRIKESGFNEFFKILSCRFKCFKRPDNKFIDSFRNTKLNSVIVSKIRKMYLEGNSAKELAGLFKICTPYISLALNYKVYPNQDVDAKERIAVKLKDRKNTDIKLINSKNEIVGMFNSGFSLRKIGRIFNCSHGHIKKVINYK